ncbi:hypothetical protein [Novosphingobium sp.]|uniref:hypothetical protein n=1 Tax=Novosphingobium sp. TaxID=1874826 RepID=UPI002736109B|nr:hypothetical protein [Novosphingobium sp.]MDP3905903.1 hypothetical protein [Novosphingobium sp.]
MTPTATRLKARLDERRRWFANEWFFKWHFIGKEGPVSIDSFDGRGIHYGGIKFSGTARQVYWDSVVRGVRKEITDQFAWVDEQVRNYTAETALCAIDESAGLIASFTQSIRREAVAKDRILRGDGITFPTENDAGHWYDTDAESIFKQAEALKRAIPLAATPSVPVEVRSLSKQASALWHDNQWWLGPLAFLVGLAGLLPLVF